jgi:hypothetical protein
MPALTAVEARDLASSAYTQEELDIIFAGVDQAIERAAALRQFFVDVAVGSNEIALLTQWITAADYTIQTSPSDADPLPVRTETNGPLTAVRIAWQGYEFRAQPLQTIPKNSVVQFILDSVGADGVEIYWQQIGTTPETDFTDLTNEGTITITGDSAVIARGVLLGATGGTTIQIAAFVEYDGTLQLVAESEIVTVAE